MTIASSITEIARKTMAALAAKPTAPRAAAARQAQTALNPAQAAMVRRGEYLTALGDALEPDLLKACMARLKVEPTAYDTPVSAMVKHAQEVAGLCSLAGMRAEAPRYVGAGVSIEVVRHQLLTLIAEKDDVEIVTAHPSPASAPSADRAYRNRKP